MTATERLALLLPIANGDPLTTAQLRQRLFDFLRGFTARHLRLPKFEHELHQVSRATSSQLHDAAEAVVKVFTLGLLAYGPHEGFEDTEPDDVAMLTLPTLAFGVFRPKKKPGRSRFDWIVEAEDIEDLVPFLAMYLLATETTRIMRCHAPRRGNWEGKCHRIFVGGGPGRARLTCDTACAVRVKNKRVNDDARKHQSHQRVSRTKAERRQRRK